MALICGRFTTTCVIGAYHHKSCEFEHRLWRGVLDTTLCDKVCQWLVTGRWFSMGTPPMVSSTNKTDRHAITEILLKVALNIINQQKPTIIESFMLDCRSCSWLYILHEMHNTSSIFISKYYNNTILFNIFLIS